MLQVATSNNMNILETNDKLADSITDNKLIN